MERLSRMSRGALSEHCVLALYDEVGQAEEAIHILQRSGVQIDKISLVTKSLGSEVAAKVSTHDDSVHDAAVGAGVGALAGILGGTAVVAAAGGAMILMLGPIGAAGITGALAGAFLGGLGGWGVHHERIAHYEAEVEQGKTLVIVRGNPKQLLDAERVLKETGPVELHLYAKTESESPEVNPVESRSA